MNKYTIHAVLTVLLALMLCSCASSPLPPPDWEYAKGAINLQLKSDAELNFREGTAHTLVVCVYQLKDPNAFNQLAGYTDGLYKLLECSLFDDSVAVSKRIIVYPGQDVTLQLDRAEGAKYVAIVAGYYLIQKERIVRLYKVPIIQKRKSMTSLAKITEPGPLSINLVLGSQQIQTAQGE